MASCFASAVSFVDFMRVDVTSHTKIYFCLYKKINLDVRCLQWPVMLKLEKSNS